MVLVLTGTLPIRPYHPTQLFGSIKADGQLPKVAALACDHQEVVAISLVGYDTSVSAALARLWQREQLVFEPDPAIDWHGPGHLGRRQENYKQFHAILPGTKEVHFLALPVLAHIAEGMLHPPDVPKPQQEPGSSSPPIQQAKGDRSRFVLGNWDPRDAQRADASKQLAKKKRETSNLIRRKHVISLEGDLSTYDTRLVYRGSHYTS